MPLTFGTSGGNKGATEMHVGTSGGNKAVTEGWVGTSGGNKQFYSSVAAISWSGTAWDAINLTHPTTAGSTNTVTATFSGGSRTITAVAASNGTAYTLSYNLNGAGLTTYSTGFSISTGQTLLWRITGAASDFSETITINDSATGAATGSFIVSKSGSP